MTSPLSGSLAATVGKAFNTLFLDASLVRDTPVDSPDPADPQPPMATTFACKAIASSYSDYYRSQGLIDAKDRKLLVLANSLSVRPEPGDRITLRGITFTAIAVSSDPAEATWEIQARM